MHQCILLNNRSFPGLTLIKPASDAVVPRSMTSIKPDEPPPEVDRCVDDRVFDAAHEQVATAATPSGATSTAVAALPNAAGVDDSITRCICGLQHDDGYMICCDRCL